MKLRSRNLDPLPERLHLTEQNLRAFSDSTITLESAQSSVNSEPMLYDILTLRKVGVQFSNSVLPPDDIHQVSKLIRKGRKGLENLQTQDFLRQLGNSFDKEAYKVHFIRCIFQPMTKAFPEEYSMQMDVEWTKLAGKAITTNLPNPKPDYFESMLLQHYPTDAIDSLQWRIQPSSHLFAMPTICAEFNGPGKGTAALPLQTAYDGAVMVDAAWEVHKFLKLPAKDFLGKTQAIVLALADNVLCLSTCHAVTASDTINGKYPEKLKYHVFDMFRMCVETENDVKVACNRIHNAQDWCYNRAKRTKSKLQNFFQEKERERNNAKRVALDAKRKLESSGPQQGRKRRKVGVEDDENFDYM